MFKGSLLDLIPFLEDDEMKLITYTQPEIKYITYRNPEWIEQSWLITILKEAIKEFEDRHRNDIDNGDKWFLNIVKRCIIDEHKYSMKQKETVNKIFNKYEEVSPYELNSGTTN